MALSNHHYVSYPKHQSMFPPERCPRKPQLNGWRESFTSGGQPKPEAPSHPNQSVH